MSPDAFDHEMAALEAQLLALGRREFEFENRIHPLRKRAREEGQAGRFAESDTAWALLQETLAELAETRALIIKIETRLYGLRRRKRN